MALNGTALREHLNGAPETDEALGRFVDAAQSHIEAQLGFGLNDDVEMPAGPPLDLEHAVLMLAAHFYENREASVVGVSAQVLPLGVEDVIRNHRRWSFG